MTSLSVNVNKIATLRNTRMLDLPSVERLSAIALQAGAHGITVHPRPDERHIRATDVAKVAAIIAKFPAAEYNIEGNPFHGLIEHCEHVHPAQATLVPDGREAFTSNHGWNLIEMDAAERAALMESIARLHAAGSRVSLFLDPVVELLPVVRDVGADRIELYTEPYASAFGTQQESAVLESYVRTAAEAARLGLGVNAGHDLNLDNLPTFLARVPDVAEVSIGHALIADALEFGLPETVRRYLSVCQPRQ